MMMSVVVAVAPIVEQKQHLLRAALLRARAERRCRPGTPTPLRLPSRAGRSPILTFQL